MVGGRASNRRGGALRGARRARPAAYALIALGACGLAAYSLAGCGLAAALSEASDGLGAETAPPPGQGPAAPDSGPAPPTGGERRAILVRGSAPVRGVPPLGRNALAALYGAYSLPGQVMTAPAAASAGEAAGVTSAGPDSSNAALTAEVWFTAEPVALGAAWTLVSCRGLPGGWLAYESRPKADGPPAWALKAAEYWLFIRFSAGRAGPCAFAAALADRFDWFRRYGGSAADLAFPALLELAP